MLVKRTMRYVGAWPTAAGCRAIAIAWALAAALLCHSAVAQYPGPTLELSPPNQAPADTLPPPPPAPAASPAPVQPKPTLAEALDRAGDVTFRSMSIEAALFTLAETWQVNIVTGKQIEGTVNGVFKQAPLREILDAVLLANGYSYRPVGDSLVVQATGSVGSANPLFRSLTIPILNANLSEAVEGARLLISEGGQIQAMPSARSMLVVDYADRVETVAAFIARLEASAAQAAASPVPAAGGRLEVSYFRTHFIPVAAAEQPLKAILSPMGRVATMPRENRLLVVDYPANLEMARKVLARVDRPRPQVRITARIYDLSLQDVEQLGLNWGSAGKGNTVDADGDANQALEFETSTMAPFATGEAGGALTVRSLTRNFDINAVALLLQSANDARLLANPNVVVEDNELAEWKSVSEIPYQQITQSELGGQIGTTAFKEAGITLRVRPTIAGDGTVEMVVEPEFSRLAGFTPQENQPIIDTRKATTTVRVADRQTLVLSGLMQRSDTGEFNGIPFLKDVKYLGPLFRSRDTNVRESELIVFIMPEIVGYNEDLDMREAVARETIDCRLNAIPPAEGCGPMGYGPEGCVGPEPLPPVEEGPLPGTPLEGEPLPAVEPQPEAPAPLRPAFEARFRADDGTSVRPQPQPPATEKPSTWSRIFGS
ncbi:MAG TPA: secretin N-terminal domain-containing protein [Lacipirellulaceae bacterium]|nr:secretin N-terminal domain-containing protein [Lacipirellulaceae bacterium]